MRVAFHTLGCKVNQYETEALKEMFSLKGYSVVDEKEFADIYVINTCTVTSLADRKSRQYIRKMKKVNPDSIVAVTGCYAQVNPEEVAAIEAVNLVAGTNQKARLVEYIEAYMDKSPQGTTCHIKPYEELTEYEETGIITSMDSKKRAFIKIQEGCNRFCSYCIIPYARGQVRSRSMEEILQEGKSLVDRGFKEIVLTGINTALYGMENGEADSGIEGIIKEISAIPGDFRIRLSSLEPTVINKDTVQRLFQYEKLCHHLHLSVQSGSNRVLTAMNRHYTREEYLEIVGLLRDFDQGYGISTDIIAGFPGEKEEDFADSLKIIREVGFCKVHAFNYSKREGTGAAEMGGHLSPDIKNRRTSALIAEGEKAARAFFKGCLGENRLVLTENIENGMIEGYTDNYIKTYIESEDEKLLNRFVRVQMIEPYKEGVKAIIVGPS